MRWNLGNSKSKVHPIMCHKCMEGGGNTVAGLLIHNLGARKGWWSKPHISHFTPWKDTGPKVKEARKWASRPVWINTGNPVPAKGSKP